MNKIKTFLKLMLQTIFSFWHYNTKEDRMARNIWAGLVLSLLVLTSLSFLVGGQI